MRRLSVGVLAVVVAACGTKTVRLTHAPKDVSSRLAASVARASCAAPPPGGGVPPVPTLREPSDAANDVVFYLAHPEDETLFTAGTMDALVRAQRRVFYVVMTHGEGGRLIQRDAAGRISERSAPPAEVAGVRDRELVRATTMLGIPFAHLYPASAGADFPAANVPGRERAVHECARTLERWDHDLPGGIGGIVERLVADIRARRPRVIVTHDPRDDDDRFDHGHHKALGALVEIAARGAADPDVPGGRRHVVEELVVIAPKQVDAPVTLNVGNEMRKKLTSANVSQFETEKFVEAAQRTSERYIVRWRASGTEAPAEGSLLASFVRPR